MKNICFFVGNINLTGGTERVTLLIANQLSLRGFNVRLLNLIDGRNPFFELNPNVYNDFIYQDKVSMKKNFVNSIRTIREYVKNHKIDTFISVDSILCVYSVSALFGLGLNHICWEHFNFNINLGSRFRDIGRHLAAFFCNRVVVLTMQDVDYWEDNIYLKKTIITHIPNPTSLNPTYILPSFDKKNILSIGRLDYIKGFDILLESFLLLKEEHNDWTLTIVGSGEEEEKLKDLSIKLNIDKYVHFISATKNLDPYFRNASVFCCSSRFEGFGMVILEAMSYGLPVISFDCDCGPREIITNDFGILVTQISSKQLALSFSEFINLSHSSYEKMSMNAYKESHKYSLDNILNIWLEII